MIGERKNHNNRMCVCFNGYDNLSISPSASVQYCTVWNTFICAVAYWTELVSDFCCYEFHPQPILSNRSSSLNSILHKSDTHSNKKKNIIHAAQICECISKSKATLLLNVLCARLYRYFLHAALRMHKYRLIFFLYVRMYLYISPYLFF